MAWRTHLLETLTGQHERLQLPNMNKCDADRRTMVVLGVRSRDPGREARLGGGVSVRGHSGTGLQWSALSWYPVLS